MDSHHQFAKSQVTITMCCYNNETTVRRAIESVLRQVFQDWRLLIIVSPSIDNTLKICESFDDKRINIIKNDNLQTWTASSLDGLTIANSEYFMWLDADDYIEENWLSELTEITKSEEFIAACGIIRLSNDGGLSFVKNPSNFRNFEFVSKANRFIRITLSILLPESFGLVNLLYSVWNTEKLRNFINWNRQDKNFDYDVDFILGVLCQEKIGISKSTNLTREVRGFNQDRVQFFSETPQGISLFELSKELIFTKPNSGRIRKAIANLPLYMRLWIELLLFTRSALSVFAPFLIRSRNLVRFEIGSDN